IAASGRMCDRSPGSGRRRQRSVRNCGSVPVATDRPCASTLWDTMLAFLGPWDFVIIVAVIAFFFGARPFGRALRALKSGGRELKRGIRGDDELPPPET